VRGLNILRDGSARSTTLLMLNGRRAFGSQARHPCAAKQKVLKGSLAGASGADWDERD
jgi:hypothetical protein